MKRGIKKFLEVCCLTGTILIGLAFIAFVAYLIALGMVSFIKGVKLRPVDLPADTPSEGVAWIMPEAGEVPVWMSLVCAGEAETAVWLDSYTEGDGPAPEWWNPGEPMAAEWVDHSGDGNKMVDADHFPDAGKMVDEDDVTDISVGDINVPCNAEPHPPVGIDAGGIDWNLCTDVEGWDGHRMEVWEMDLFSRIVFLEFGISSPECREAGIDAILRLWESGYYSSTMFGTLSAVAENGKPAFSTYPGVWEEEYDYEKLARFREECEERFVNGPEWIAPFFRLDHYHDWAVPCYEIDGVYFSTGKGW